MGALSLPNGLCVAVTGGIAEGKSTVMQMIAERGYAVASADAIARELFLRPDVNAQLARLAGRDAPIEPAELREAILRAPAIRREVNRLLHPLIAKEMAASGASFIEVPLLIETCMQTAFDRVWVVTCGEETQRERLMARYGDEGTVTSILATQLPSRAKIPFADVIIRTNYPVQHVRRLLSKALAGLQA